MAQHRVLNELIIRDSAFYWFTDFASMSPFIGQAICSLRTHRCLTVHNNVLFQHVQIVLLLS